MDKIPLDCAKLLCDAVWKRNRKKYLSYYHWWCWGCRKFSKTFEDRCFNSADQLNRGCPQMNKLYEEIRIE